MPPTVSPKSIHHPLYPLVSPNVPRNPTLTIRNRFLSILFDSVFTKAVGTAYALPLIANERCGSWYIQPDLKAGSAYFKSTDGHHGQWSFSTRRLNLGVLDVVARTGGCVLVDSTRRGKSMPDALSKTVPIWCAVMNRILFPDLRDAHSLYTPPRVVGLSEHAQIEDRLDGFVEDFRALQLPIDNIRSNLTKPLRPLWVIQDSPLLEERPSFDDFYPIVCCTASRQVEGPDGSEGGYIQGAGDDSEGWAKGLTPTMFWENSQQLLDTAEEELPALMANLVRKSPSMASNGDAILVKPTAGVHMGTLETLRDADKDRYDCIVVCSDTPAPEQEASLDKKTLYLNCGRGKLGSRDLRKELHRVRAFIGTPSLNPSKKPKFLFVCSTGKDLSVGVALSVLCLFFDSQGNYTGLRQNTANTIDKQFIRQRLSWILATKRDANPSRTTLQAVNGFLMKKPA